MFENLQNARANYATGILQYQFYDFKSGELCYQIYVNATTLRNTRLSGIRGNSQLVGENECSLQQRLR